MKMMRSTRTTSTSGVTLISDLGPSPPPMSMLMILTPRPLLLGLFFGDETHVLESGVLDHPHDVLDVTEVQALVGLDEHVLVGGALAQLLHLRGEFLVREPLRVDEDGLVGLHGDEKLLGGLGFLVGPVRLREHHGFALLEHRRHDHEDDEENEAHVDERRHVDVALHALTTAEAIHSHEQTPRSRFAVRFDDRWRRRADGTYARVPGLSRRPSPSGA